MQATPEQYNAIYIHDKNLIVTAGAGSGKTRVLVERFITLLDTHRNWKLPMIVAITFTEKAAREMRERIRTNIQQRVQAAPDPSARALWQQQQGMLDAARISTIHRLCAQILRANPVEARLDPMFTVLDEVETYLLVREAVDQTLAALIKEDNGAVARLLAVYEVRTVREVLEAFAMRSAARHLQQSLQGQTVDSLLGTWYQTWEAIIAQQLAQLQADTNLQQALEWFHTVDGPHLHGDKLRGVWERVLQHHTALMEAQDPQQALDALNALQSAIRLNVGSKSAWGGVDVLKAAKDQLKSIREQLEAAQKLMLPEPAEDDAQAAELVLCWGEAVAAAQAYYEALKDKQNALDFDDLEERTADLLEAFPQVAARYANATDGEFKHIMVDEFQDTNDNQRRIVYALAGVDVEAGTAIPGRLFVVGDPKQSIYAFRGADVSVFDRVQREILATGGQALALTRSFRSQPHLVGMFNAVFAQILRREDTAAGAYSVGYEPMTAHRTASAQQQTPLELVILPKPDDEDERRKKVSTEDRRRWEAYRVAEFIREHVAAGRAQYGDIALLFQSMSHVGIYESMLQAAGVPYVTVAGRGYFGRQEVWDLMNLLAVLHRPMDDLALASVLRSPMFGLSDDALFALRLRKRDDKLLPLWEALLATDDLEAWPVIEYEEDHYSIAFAQQVLPTLHQLAGRVTIAELLQTALEQTGFEAVMAALPNGERRRANIRKLLQVARQSDDIALSDFTLRLHDMVAVEAREGEATLETENVVQLMSVHRSKGLEFPVVIVPDASWTRSAGSATLMVDAQLGAACKFRLPDNEWCTPTSFQLALNYAAQRDDYERRRLLYVAMTRAEDLLLVTGLDTQKGWLGQLQAALDLDFGKDELVQGRSILNYEWGQAVFDVPPAPARFDAFYTAIHPTSDETSTTTAHFTAAEVVPTPPPLLPRPAIMIPGERLHVQATDLERFGHIRFEDPAADARHEFRLQVLKNLPGPVQPLSLAETRQRRLQTVRGNTLHHALQMGLLPQALSKQVVEKALMAYVWEQGISDERTRRQVVKKAIDTLHHFETSSLKRQLDAATQVYREIEFVLEYGRYVIHGVIDLLFRLNGEWHVVDYKSGRPPRDQLAHHAERYLYQLGAYARAIEAQTGETPIASIHFLHYNEMVTITEARWRAAMQTLDSELEHALNEENV